MSESLPWVDPNATPAEVHATLLQALDGMLVGERDWIANLANASALLMGLLPNLNWAGFYLYKHGELVVGPFQGKPACVRIALDRGVCGAAATARQTLVVADVHAFPGHIACDAASLSEVVVPLIAADGRLLGVMDLDSPLPARFDAADAAALEVFAARLVAGCDV